MSGYCLSLFRYGFTGTAGEAHPLRRVQALIRHRAHEAEAIERWLIINDIRAFLADEECT